MAGDVGESQEGSAIVAAVDLETGEKTGPETDADQSQIEAIRELAQRLLVKWEQLPVRRPINFAISSAPALPGGCWENFWRDSLAAKVGERNLK